MSEIEHEVVRMSDDIEQYLVEHPNAADTLEGITMWWLQKQKFTDSLDQILKALDNLKERGLVEERRRLDGNNIYISTFPGANHA